MYLRSSLIGEYIQTCHEGNSGGGHYREGEEEDGFGPSCHSENGHDWSNCSRQQLRKHKVRL